jgi:hypothetical protein
MDCFVFGLIGGDLGFQGTILGCLGVQRLNKFELPFEEKFKIFKNDVVTQSKVAMNRK